jgi:hypothetical protein
MSVVGVVGLFCRKQKPKAVRCAPSRPSWCVAANVGQSPPASLIAVAVLRSIRRSEREDEDKPDDTSACVIILRVEFPIHQPLSLEQRHYSGDGRCL